MTLGSTICPSRDSRVRPPDLEVRPWQPGDTAAINRLYNDPAARPGAAVHGYVPRTASQWAWEYAASSSAPPAYVVATHQGNIVGTQAYIPIEFLLDGRRLLTGKDEDTLIHPQYRGLGLLDDMYRLLFRRAEEDGVELLWGFTNTANRPLLRNGYFSIGRFEAMRARSPHNRTQPVPASIDVSELLEPDERCDAFSQEFGRHCPGLTTHLSGRYLRWRALDDPYYAHRIFVASADKRILGLSAFKLNDRERVGFVSELTAIPAERRDLVEILHALLQPGLELFRARNYRFVEARFSGPHPFNQTVKSVLTQRGFEKLDDEHAAELLVRPMTPSGERFRDYGAWRIAELMREY